MEAPPYAAIYERLGRPVMTRLMSDRGLADEYRLATELLRLEPGHRVLDVASGPGNFARHFVDPVGEEGLIVGLDRSSVMLARADSLRRRGRLSNLHFVRGDALHLPFHDAVFDRAHCAGALHLMADIPRALSEIRRVVRVGGLVVIGTFLSVDSKNLLALTRRLGNLAGIHLFKPGELEERLHEANLILDWSSTSRAAHLVRAVAR